MTSNGVTKNEITTTNFEPLFESIYLSFRNIITSKGQTLNFYLRCDVRNFDSIRDNSKDFKLQMELFLSKKIYNKSVFDKCFFFFNLELLLVIFEFINITRSFGFSLNKLGN